MVPREVGPGQAPNYLTVERVLLEGGGMVACLDREKSRVVFVIKHLGNLAYQGCVKNN